MTAELTREVKAGDWLEVHAGENAGLVGVVVGHNADKVLLRIQGGRHMLVDRSDVGPAKAK